MDACKKRCLQTGEATDGERRRVQIRGGFAGWFVSEIQSLCDGGHLRNHREKRLASEEVGASDRKNGAACDNDQLTGVILAYIY